MDLLRAESSPQNPLTTERICKTLIGQGINCDRKTLTKDIQTLRNYGYEIEVKQIGHEKGYFVPEKKRDFSLAEQKIITQTSHTTSGNKALINAGWDTNQLISCVFTAFVILMASVLTPSIKMLTRLDRAVHSSMSCMSSQHT